MTTKLEKFLRFVPPELKPRVNPILNALLQAWAGSDQEIMTQLQNCKAQLFVKTAEGVYLDKVAANFGVSRPSELGLLDEDFQKLIPNLSLKAKQVAKSFYDTMDVFWGPTFSRANITSGASAPFNISVGDTFSVSIDGGNTIQVTVKPGDIAINGAATAREMLNIFSLIEDLTAEVSEDPTTGDERINLRTNTPGSRGSIEVISGFGSMSFETGKRFRVTDLPQRTVLYQINPGEILIELPAVVPTLRRTLKGSHHFHENSDIEPVIAPATKPWQGSFLYSSNENPFVVTEIKGILEEPVLKGSVINQITISDSSPFPATGGSLIFNFGKSSQEQPVKYIAIPNSKTILVDPGHSFAQTHEVGAEINYLSPGQSTPYAPRITGNDLAIYLTSPANARSIVQEILGNLTAAGIVANFLILLPEYKYHIDNPFSDEE